MGLFLFLVHISFYMPQMWVTILSAQEDCTEGLYLTSGLEVFFYFYFLFTFILYFSECLTFQCIKKSLCISFCGAANNLFHFSKWKGLCIALALLLFHKKKNNITVLLLLICTVVGLI